MERVYEGGISHAREVAGVGFVPNPLPPNLDLGALYIATIHGLLEAQSSLSDLATVARDLDNPYLLMGPFATREAKLSSAIEDTFASARQVMLFEFDVDSDEPENRSDTLEVANYVSALNFGYKSELPLCQRLFREMHAILLNNVKRDAGIPGEFRTTQNAIGSRRGGFEDATFVPPPPRFLDTCLSEFESFLNARCDLPALITIAMSHYQFECIHPFDDGNGRLGRLLIALQLCRQANLATPLVYISGFFEQNRSEYYRRLLNVSSQNDWLGWIQFFLTAVNTQARDAYGRAKRLLALRERYRDLVREKQASPLLPILIDKLFERPVLTASMVCKYVDVTPKSAGALIRRLEAKSIVREVTGWKRNRVFLAEEIMTLIES